MLESALTLAGLASTAIWAVILLSPWRPWSTRESLDAEPRTVPVDLSDVTVLIPARNEAAFLEQTLRCLREQGQGLRVVLVDDQSSDGTADLVTGIDWPELVFIRGTAPPLGWSGKLWALEQGRGEINTPLILLLDADISLTAGTIATVKSYLEHREYALVSLMARPHLNTLLERWLMPAFVFFFKLLYPFHLSNSKTRWVAAAAGGCIMIETEVLKTIGGFTSIRDKLIDDCALARRVKTSGHRTWIGLSHSVQSQRQYARLKDTWDMVARNAYVQLRHSVGLLVICTLLMILMFWWPVAGLLSAETRPLAGITWLAMIMAYTPTLLYYRRSLVWALTLPALGTLFLAMTWSSAWRDWHGVRSRWKGRTYRRGEIR